MLKRTYSEDEVNTLLSSVEAAFGAHLQKSEEELLTKSEAAQETKPEGEVEEPKELAKNEEEECVDEELEKAYRDMSKAEQKAHMDMLKRAMGDEDQMHKSEEFESLKKSQEELQKENEELKKSLEASKEDLAKLVAALSKRVSAVPPQKSVTEIATIRKSEGSDQKEFSKQEITQILVQKAKEKTLAKSDREAINQFYKTGSADVTLIQHLLK